MISLILVGAGRVVVGRMGQARVVVRHRLLLRSPAGLAARQHFAALGQVHAGVHARPRLGQHLRQPGDVHAVPLAAQEKKKEEEKEKEGKKRRKRGEKSMNKTKARQKCLYPLSTFRSPLKNKKAKKYQKQSSITASGSKHSIAQSMCSRRAVSVSSCGLVTISGSSTLRVRGIAGGSVRNPTAGIVCTKRSRGPVCQTVCLCFLPSR